MTESRPDNEAIFHAARDIADPDRRREYVREACGGDEARTAHVEALLAVADAPDSLLDCPAIGPAANDTRTEPSAPDTDAPLDFLAPTDKPGALGRMGYYDILDVIGRGGMGVVLRAFDEKLHRVVAIKVMATQLATNATARKRFAREAQAAAAVSHDHIVTIHAVEEANPLPYLVMQYVAGLSLQQRLDRDGPLDLQEILRIGMQTASGLAAAHAQGLVHRDIKPANILLENGVERVKVTDFGLARAFAEASLTQSGVVAGTPQYMSPEQARGDPVDQRTDLFSLGSVLYAMCTGRAPFRASGSMAVLKRVCEETPTPIRQTNPAIPDWLIAIIAKLQAKDPAERYQSAAEVAALLGRHLAHVQHPSVVGQVSNLPADPKAGWKPAPHRRRLAIAAAVLLCFIAGLSLTEATGITNLRATVIRIFTPDGTLIVEVDDPSVKVTIEGDGGILITGAGPQEVRLRPGSYKVHADRDGKRVPLERELVGIAKGGREVVRVKLEAPAAPAAAKAEKGAFVRLGGEGVAERKFDTLADAVLSASDGDTIEIRGNGPFVSQPINIRGTTLTIRAAEGFRPVIQLSSNITTDSPLVLEGLELQRLGQKVPQGSEESLVFAWGGSSLHVANCRFREHLTLPSIRSNAPKCFLRNCAFLGPSQWVLMLDAKEFVLDNCLVGGALQINSLIDQHDTSVQLTHSTLLSAHAVLFQLDLDKPRKLADVTVKLTQLEASDNIFDATSVVFLSVVEAFLASIKPLQPKEAEAFLLRRLAWRDRRNLYAPGSSCLLQTTYSHPAGAPSQIGPQNISDWKRFWGTPDGDAIEGHVRYQGGDLRSKMRDSPEKLTPDDFRLRADSAGYRAGKDGKDLGADIDFVGPGPAYERWKKTPEYQQWLKDTGQVKK